jgi:ABC-type branched-subunit amino acid transport system substrate-binding protein
MSKGKVSRVMGGAVAAVAALGLAVSAQAQEKKLKIGVVYDLTGPFAGGGSELHYIGARIMLDYFTKTGIEGYNIEAVYADAQSKPEVAINEAAPGRAGEGRDAAGLLLLGRVRAGGGAG